MIELACDNEKCGKKFDYELRRYKYNLKNYSNAKFYCQKSCQTSATSKKHAENCSECGIAILVANSDWKKSISKNYFCSRSCRAKHQNAKRKIDGYSTKEKLKTHQCIKCCVFFEGSIHLVNGTKICPNCIEKSLTKTTIRKRNIKFVLSKFVRFHRIIKSCKFTSYTRIKANRISKNCKLCNLDFTFKDTFIKKSKRVYCDSCLATKRKEAGIKSAMSQSRQSKNEKLFGEIIQKEMPLTEMLFNKPYFKDKNGNMWDADIIIPDMKIAIHWNGNWHYQDCKGKSSLSQTQNRDKIKYKLIESQNYKNYIIVDRDKFSKKKVQEELDKFLLHFFL